jgi:hypothetical protein
MVMSTTHLMARCQAVMSGANLVRSMALSRLGLSAVLLLSGGLALSRPDVYGHVMGLLVLSSLLVLHNAAAVLESAEPANVAALTSTKKRYRLPEVWFSWSAGHGWQLRRLGDLQPPLRKNLPSAAGRRTPLSSPRSVATPVG